jgi:hypothetical protein
MEKAMLERLAGAQRQPNFVGEAYVAMFDDALDTRPAIECRRYEQAELVDEAGGERTRR